ncbi:hypothetical protein C8Q76DRAFT_695023 [Earliella scabrosa]|nr:hypothetical protein C8Q76DRAFT_695023 [Earliella scabrosa]
MWPVYVMPQYLLDFIPEEYWIAYIFYLNRVDPAQKPVDSTELFATWLFHIDHLYNQLYRLEEHHYSISTVADKKITDIYGQSKIHYLTSPKMHGELSLNHPRVLSTLAAALHIPPARLNFHQAVFKVIKESNYWPIVTFLELGVAQLQPYATVPYQHWNDFVSDDSTESQPPTASKKSATTVRDRQGNSDRMEKFIDSLEKGDMDLLWAWPDPSRLAQKPGFYNFTCLPQKSFIWTAICGGGSKADGTSGTWGYFKDLVHVVYLLVWVLSDCQTTNHWASTHKNGNTTFGRFAYSNSADDVILAYLAAVQSASNDNWCPSLPSLDNMELAVLYDNATSEGLNKLHKVALVLIDVGEELIAALSESMCHSKQDATPPPNPATIAKSKGRHSSYFYWCPENSPRLHLFDIRVQHGKQQTLPGPNHCSGFLSPLHVHVGHKVTGQEE